jgi:hypothetical protein
LSATPIDPGPTQNVLDDLLRNAAWNLVFGAGEPIVWPRIIDDLIARGAEWPE